MMVKKNDLSAFKRTGPTKDVLAQAEATASKPPRKKKAKTGRPAVKEKRTFRVTLLFTEAEGKVIQKKAGMVNTATYVMSKVDGTDLLK